MCDNALIAGLSFFTWQNAVYFFPKVLSALPVTLVGLLLGMGLAFVQLEKVPFLTQLCRVFVSFTQGTPIIIQMFIVYYGPSMVLQLAGLNITR
jgi:L-cystine transport system permease protein